MVTKIFKLMTGVGLITVLAMPLGVAAQDNATNKPKHTITFSKTWGRSAVPAVEQTESQPLKSSIMRERSSGVRTSPPLRQSPPATTL